MAGSKIALRFPRLSVCASPPPPPPLAYKNLLTFKILGGVLLGPPPPFPAYKNMLTFKILGGLLLGRGGGGGAGCPPPTHTPLYAVLVNEKAIGFTAAEHGYLDLFAQSWVTHAYTCTFAHQELCLHSQVSALLFLMELTAVWYCVGAHSKDWRSSAAYGMITA